MIGPVLQFFVVLAAWDQGGADGRGPLWQELQLGQHRAKSQELYRELEAEFRKLRREFEAKELDFRKSVRGMQEAELGEARRMLGRTRKMVNDYEGRADPTPAEVTFLKFLKAWEPTLRNKIAGLEATLREP